MKICYFGDYDSNYSRNKIIIQGLRENGFSVEEVKINKSKSSVNFVKELFKLSKEIKQKYDVCIVGYSDNRLIVPLLKLFGVKKIYWDAFYSIFDSWVYDRELVGRFSIKYFYYWFIEFLNCQLSFRIILDTEEHIKFFVNTFIIKRKKFIKVYVGSFARKLENSKQNENNFSVFFYGKYIPLQGVEYIIKSAKIVERDDIVFRLVGKGQTYNNARKLAKDLQVRSIEFIDRVSFEELEKYTSEADVCLGIFGKTAKAKRVIPNKVYDAIAMAKPVISGNTPALNELFEDKKNILMCDIADEKDLAKKILELKNDESLREKIARGADEIYKNKLLPKIVVDDLVKEL